MSLSERGEAGGRGVSVPSFTPPRCCYMLLGGGCDVRVFGVLSWATVVDESLLQRSTVQLVVAQFYADLFIHMGRTLGGGKEGGDGA